MKILHIAPDYKFMPFIAETFSAFANITNLFLINNYNNVSDAGLGNIPGNTRFIDGTYFSSAGMTDDLAWCDCLIVHFLDEQSVKMILESPPRVVVIWSGWGGDYYKFLPSPQHNLCGDYTREFVTKLQSRTPELNFVRRTINWIKQTRRKLLLLQQMRQAIKRIDYFSAPLQEDFTLLQAALGSKFRAQYVQLNYGSVERTFSQGPATLTANNILVGNSATATNNHIEIFKALAGLDLGDRKIIVPLSYSDHEYRDGIVRYGNELFGGRFQPIVDFMPLERYSTLIAECSVVIMGHRRQQGTGNSASMLYKGAKVFLDEASTWYQFLKRQGAYVFSLNQLQPDDESVFQPLSEQQKQKNREVLETYWGHDVVLDNVRNLIETVQARMINHA